MGFRRPNDQPDYPDFWLPPGTGPEEAEVILRQVSANRFQLLYGFCYDRKGTAETHEVPAHSPHADPRVGENSTDLASVPTLVTWFIGTYGLHTKAAILHDHLVRRGMDRRERKEADALFRDALRESGVRWLRRWLMWTAVSLRTRWGRRRMIAILVHLAAFWGAMVWWLAGSPPWLGWSIRWWWPLGIGVTGFAWGLRRWPLAVFGFALVALPASFALVSRGVAWVTEVVEEAWGVVKARRAGIERPFETPMLNPSAKKSL